MWRGTAEIVAILERTIGSDNQSMVLWVWDKNEFSRRNRNFRSAQELQLLFGRNQMTDRTIFYFVFRICLVHIGMEQGHLDKHQGNEKPK